MIPSGIRYNSERAAKARLGLTLGHKSIQAALLVLVFAGLLSGITTLTFLHSSLGWLVLILSSAAYMLRAWYRHELKPLPPVGGDSLDAIIEGSLLAHLHEGHSPRDIGKIVAELEGGRFFAFRFGILPQIYTDYTSEKATDSATLWAEAADYAKRHGLTEITSVCLVPALVKSLPNYESYLADLLLDPEDLDRGVDWKGHISSLIENHSKKRLYGGIGRDWAFGFTPLLSRFGYNITEHIQNNGQLQREIEGHQEVIGQALQLLSSGARRNAVLVGGVGAGKTTLVQGLAEKLIDPDENAPASLRYNQVISLDPATLIAQASARGELEQLVQRLLVEAVSAKNIILFLDDAQLFLEDGTGSVNLSNILLPVLEGGAVRMVLAMDEQRWLQLAQANPALSQLMNRVVVSPMDYEDTLKVMQDQLLLIESRTRVAFFYQSLHEAYRLSERYVQDQVMPGRAIKLLESSANFAENGFVTVKSVQSAIEKTYNIKVGNASSSSGDERDMLLNLEQLIHQRMINQTRAVQVVSDALRRARAGVRNQNRPIGTFLFLGPTGVGKTELAKALAAVYFGGEERMARIDLNEYVRSEDLIRLIADAGTDANSLAAQISRQPFSVVLLDEIEKAHPDVLSALLQLLDEGVLRDSNNREVSFRDAIIVATSNAGADQIRGHIERGEAVEQFEEPLVNELINSQQFRPEFLNRFDEIVVFRPLTAEELLQVVDLIIAGTNKTLSAQKISVVLTDQAKWALVQQGYDPRLGARPLRRVVQRTVENVLAQRLLSGQVRAGDQVVLDLPDITPNNQPTAPLQPPSVPPQV